MPKIKDPSRLAATFAASAQKEFSALKSALQQAEQSLSKLRGTLHVAVPKGGSRTIKGSRSSPSLLVSAGASSLGGFFSSQIVSGGGSLLGDLFDGGDDFSSGDIGGSFQQSATQFAAKIFDASLRGQRIR
jgi:hypothetical protein